jgi:hypothetical protein
MAQSINDKYVKQTNDLLTNANANLELVAIQLTRLPPREQNRFFRLVLNFIDIVSRSTYAGMADNIALSNKLIKVIEKHYEEAQG